MLEQLHWGIFRNRTVFHSYLVACEHTLNTARPQKCVYWDKAIEISHIWPLIQSQFEWRTNTHTHTSVMVTAVPLVISLCFHMFSLSPCVFPCGFPSLITAHLFTCSACSCSLQSTHQRCSVQHCISEPLFSNCNNNYIYSLTYKHTHTHTVKSRCHVE